MPPHKYLTLDSYRIVYYNTDTKTLELTENMYMTERRVRERYEKLKTLPISSCYILQGIVKVVEE